MKSGTIRLSTFLKRPSAQRWLWICSLLVAIATWPALSGAGAVEATGNVYYVAPGGSDQNRGSLDAPFRTIQRCADVAMPGDTCLIRAGTYRETVVVPRSGTAGNPIAFKPYGSERVVISGADVITPAWSLYRDRIYKTSMPWSVNTRRNDTLEIVANDQVFVDGQMMVEARWPNVPAGKITRLANADNARADGATIHSTHEATYHDAALDGFAPGFWEGARINFGPGFDTIHTTCDVIGSAPGSIRFECKRDPAAGNERSEWHDEELQPGPGNYYYLWGKLEALDAPGEWLRTGDGTLYLWSPDGANPATHTVEARRRLWAFDISERSYVTIEGLHLFAATIRAGEQTHHALIQGITARYLWHFQQIPPFFWAEGTRAIELRGSDNVLRDSDLAYSAGAIVLVVGTNNLVYNNVIRDGGYMGHAPVISAANTPGGAQKNELRQNTIFNGGHILVDAAGRLDITYNDLYNSHLQISDLGVIYGWATDGKGAEIAYNLIHDNHAERDLSINYFGGHGIYLDDDTYNFKVYRNVVWNTTASAILTHGTNGRRMPDPKPDPGAPSNRTIYNNTVEGEIRALAKSDAGGLPQTLAGTEFKNNVATVFDLSGPGLVAASNYQGDGLFLDPAVRDYRPRPDSPLVNAGLDLGSPYMDPPMAPVRDPDIGAYEHDRPPLVAGALLLPAHLAALRVRCDPDLAREVATCTVENLPTGRKAPNDFQVRIGAGSPGRNCVTRMDVTAHTGTVICDNVSIAGQQGVQPLSVRLGSTGWVETGDSVDLRALAVDAVSPRTGLTVGSTLVTITGRQFSREIAGYRVPIALDNGSDGTLYNYQVLVALDTRTLIDQGKLRSDCGDLRFYDSYGSLAYWIEEGCGTARTRIWVKVPVLPPGRSSIDLTYGNARLASASSGPRTFVFFDDFEDGIAGEGWDVPTSIPGVTFAETGGQMRIFGTLEESNQNQLFSFALAIDAIRRPGSFAIDSEMSVVAPSASAGFKANAGGFEETLTLFGAPEGDPPGKKIGYYAGGWQVLGKSSVGGAQFAKQKFSLGLTGTPANRTIRWIENGELARVLATRTGVRDPGLGFFGYGPDGIAPFDARFDNVRVRNYTFPEPVATVGREQPSGLSVLFGDRLCRGVIVSNTTSLTCLTPPNGEGPADVTVVNPDGERDTLVDAFTYVTGQASFLPVVER